MARCPSCDPTRIAYISIMSVVSIISVVSVVFRMVSRRIQRTASELNDYLCILALVFGLALYGYTMHSLVQEDLGIRTTATDEYVLELQYEGLLVGQLLWATSVTLVRASVLSLYICIFRTPSFRSTCYGVHAFNLGFFVATVLACCLICRPFAYNWNHSIEGTCGDQRSLELFLGVFNLLIDVTTVVLPLPVLWGLQMPTSKKFILSGMFSMGIVICAITGVRIKVTTEINSPDPQVQWALNALLVNLEVKLGIINACLPVMKPVFNKLGKIGPFTASSIWSSQWRLKGNRDASGHRILSLRKYENRPSHIRRDSYHKFSDDSLPDGQVPASKSATFPQQLQSKPYYPQKKWGNGSLEMATGKAGQVITQIDGGHHRGI
ncbi:hypothetical protein JMJ35_001852 [Cladonia borealis]|uniref:Rhodopsin domain-containing protein n=1 Tax=Cladonia borealis TaxID=184061 RepID=A0AA39V4H3_9LECA|nr:hypothetical protein JMJ35_001852 [Cladonia borealis]